MTQERATVGPAEPPRTGRVDPDPGSGDPIKATIPAEPGRRDYFPELDALRFLAFMLVYLFHRGVPQWNRWVRSILETIVPARWVGDAIPTDLGLRIQSNGWIGVQIFFVLSGFLITTLLLREEQRYGRIDLRSFWVRRILRIWPLYYFVLILAVVVLPLASGALMADGTTNFLRKQFVAFVAFLGNWSMGLVGPPPNDATSVLWSVCVEEQFYIVCPLLLAFVPRRIRVGLLVALVPAAIFLRHVMAERQVNPLLFSYSTLTHVDSLVAGVLLAFVLVRPRARLWLTRLSGPLMVAVALAFGWILTRPDFARDSVTSMTWHYVAIWLATVGLIAVLVLRNGWLNAAMRYSRLVWLGKISYGLYMYHEIALWIGDRGFASLGWFPNKEVLQTIACLALTIGMAAASFTFFEKPFLALKKNWTRVPSRPE